MGEVFGAAPEGVREDARECQGSCPGVRGKMGEVFVAAPRGEKNPVCAYCHNEFAGSTMSIGTTASVVLDTPDRTPVARPGGAGEDGGDAWGRAQGKENPSKPTATTVLGVRQCEKG